MKTVKLNFFILIAFLFLPFCLFAQRILNDSPAISNLFINNVLVSNPELETHFESDQTIRIDGDSIHLDIQIIGATEGYINFWADYNKNKKIDQFESLGTYKIDSNGRMVRSIKLTESQLDSLERSQSKIDFQVRFSEDKKAINNTDFQPEGTATMSFKIIGPIVTVDSGPGDHLNGIICVLPQDTFLNLHVGNLNPDSGMVINNIIIPEIESGVNVTPLPSAYIPEDSYHDFTFEFDFILQDSFPLIDSCFNVPIEVIYQQVLPILAKDTIDIIIERGDTIYEFEYYYDTLYSEEKTFLDTLEYCYCLEELNSGKTSTSRTSSSELALESISLQPRWNIFPNPTDGFLNISYVIRETTNLQIQLSSINGNKTQILLNQKQKEKGEYADQINISQLDSGIYLLIFITDEGIRSQKILKK